MKKTKKDGRLQLRSWLHFNGVSQREFARKVRSSQGNIGSIVTLASYAGPKLSTRIEKITGIAALSLRRPEVLRG